MRQRRTGIVAAALLALIPLRAAASDQEDALKLAARIASAGSDTATVALHALPPGLADAIPLPKATLLGSVARSPVTEHRGDGVVVRGRGVSLYYDAPAGTRDAVVDAYRGALQSAGFSSVQPFGAMAGGFAPSAFNVRLWCRGGAHPAAVSVLSSDSDAVTVSADINPESAQSACRPNEQMMALFSRTSRLPTFEARSGVAIDRGGPAAYGSTSGARITSSLGVGPVFEIFAKQLRDAGWSPRAAATGTGVQTQTFGKTIDGKAYVVLLALHALDATHYVALTDVSSVAP